MLSKSSRLRVHKPPPLHLFLACAILFVFCDESSATDLNLRRSAIVRAVEAAKPSVVNIHGKKTVRPEPGELSGSDSLRKVNGMGTGVVIDEHGYIITNYHVVEGVSRIQITTHDHRTMTARIVARDTRTDLAILKISADQKIPVIRIGSSHDLMQGEDVIAIGNALGYEHTATRGIISALHRSVQVSDEQQYNDVIQTDASINPGNSGGPLLNISGEMIGINVAVRVGAQGIAFTIPIDEALEIAAELLKGEHTDYGVFGKMVRKNDQLSYTVNKVRNESSAAKSGLQSGDIIKKIDGRAIARSLDFERALIGRRRGEEIELSIQRDDKTLMLSFVLGDAPSKSSLTVEKEWEEVGIRLSPAPADEIKKLNSDYIGGMIVDKVRENSPASLEGVIKGDILVGMLGFATTSHKDIAYILKSAKKKKLDAVKFFILRDGKTYYSHFQIASKPID